MNCEVKWDTWLGRGEYKAQKVTWELTKRKQETGPGLYGRQTDKLQMGRSGYVNVGELQGQYGRHVVVVLRVLFANLRI